MTLPYLKIDRAMLDHHIVGVAYPNNFVIWSALLYEATWGEKNILIAGKQIDLQPDQAFFTIRTLSAKTERTRRVVERTLRDFKDGGMVRVTHVTGGSVITICNYSQYQPQKNEAGQGRDSGVTAKPKKKTSSSGSRLQSDWVPSPDNIEYAIEKGMTHERARETAEDFRDYWISATGQTASKCNWDATWRTWVRRNLKKAPRGANMAGRAPFREGRGGHSLADEYARRQAGRRNPNDVSK
ncbi:MAG: hypothetical protein KTR28_08785 [Micavibrio sp.]|nr:hypothetical protein [Micavibrio sp.]